MTYILIVVFLVAICIISFSGIFADHESENDSASIVLETESKMNENGDGIMNVSRELHFLYEHYNIKADEVSGLDLVRLFEDYGFDETDYTEEAVRRIIRTQGKYYIDDGTTELLSIFKSENTTDYSSEKNIARIGYSCIFGNRPYMYIFHLDENKAYYYDENKPHSYKEIELPPAQAEEIAELIIAANVEFWDHHYEGKETPTTGSLSWKIVLLLEDGESCIYDGYTGDGSHLPDSFDILANGLEIVMNKLVLCQ